MKTDVILKGAAPRPWQSFERCGKSAVSCHGEDHPEWMDGPGTSIVADEICRPQNALLITRAVNSFEVMRDALKRIETMGIAGNAATTPHVMKRIAREARKLADGEE